jgi:uncharacterized repeat protein (TIGR02543 family)
MKKFTWIVALLAALAFMFVGCGDGGGGDDDIVDDTEYTVTFNKNTEADVTGMPAAVTVKSGAKVTKPATDPSRADGYDFGGWHKYASGDSEWKFTTDTVTKDTTLYAYWSKAIGGNLGSVTVSNNATQKGWATNGTDDIETNLDIVTLINAQYLELTLEKKPIGGVQIIWQGDGDDWNWNQNAITDDNGNFDSAKGAVLTEEADDTFTLKIELSKALANYGALEDSYKAKIFIAYYSPNFDALGIIKADLIASLTPINFVFITFDAKGGDFGGDIEKLPYKPVEELIVRIKKGESMGSKFPANPLKAGFHLEKWVDDSDATVTESTTINDDVTLTAVWAEGDPVNLTVSFNTDGGSAAPADITVPEGSAIGSAKFPANPTKADHIFAGWFDSDTMSTQYTATTPAITAAITLKAKWEAIVYPDPPNVTSSIDDFDMTKVLKVDGGNDLGSWLIGKGNIVGDDVAAIKAAKPNSIILLSVICTTNINYGFGTFGDVGLSAPGGGTTAGTTFFVKLSVSDLLAAGTNATATQYFVNVYNDCSIQKVELWEPGASYVPPLDVFKNGTFAAGWSSDGTVANGAIEVTPTTGGAKPSYKITLTATTAINLDDYKYLEVQWDDACDPHILQIGFNATWYGATAPAYLTTAEGLSAWQQKTIQHEIGSKFEDWSDNKTDWAAADKTINKLELFADFIQGGESWAAAHDLTDSEVGIFSFKRVTFTKY